MPAAPQHTARETEQKALEINLDARIYGSFAEIGAGQEVARYFFQAGGAAGTVAKTMSAYDKTYSDEIYGAEPSGRYVCESRLYKMLDHEYELLEQRLRNERPESTFFSFADTVSAINYSRTIKGNGWMGIRFQLSPRAEPNDLVLHVRMLDLDNHLQQQAIGILGVNLIYGVFRYHNDPSALLHSLIDSLHGRVVIDMVRLTGPDFKTTDNRLICLKIVELGLSTVAIFGPDGRALHASEAFYKKNLLVVRGSFRPVTLVNQDMLKASYEQFRAEPDVTGTKTDLLAEITLDNLRLDGQLDERDFLERAELLCAMGQTVIVSDCEQHQKLIAYFADYRVGKLGLVLGARTLLDIINQQYFANRDGNLFLSFGQMFPRNVKAYVYPILQEGSPDPMTAQNLPVPEGIKFLYRHLIDSGHITDVAAFDPTVLHIYSRLVIERIRRDEPSWEDMVPARVAKLIKEKHLFGFPLARMEFDY